MSLGTVITQYAIRTGQIIAGAALLVQMIGAVLPQSALAQAGGVYDYTAATFSEAARQGAVDAAGIRWQCRGSRCTVSGPWPQPGVMACRALAQQVGRIKSYGHSGASLNASQLAECNGDTANPAVSNKNVAVPQAQQNLPPVNNKAVTPGPVSGPRAGTMSNLPQAILQTGRPAGQFRTAQQTWYCDGTRCNIPGQSGPLSGGDRSVDDCSRLAQAAGLVTWFSDGREIFNEEKLSRCNSPYVNSYEVLACSGADDLRSASHLRIGLAIQDRPFNDGSYRRILAMGIRPDSCQTELITGPAFRLSELASINLKFQSYDSGAFQTDDNWDMTRFRVMANVTEPGGRTAILRVVDEQREPVKRFKGRDSWQFLVPR